MHLLVSYEQKQFANEVVQAQWEFRLKETYTSEEKFLWLSQLVWDIFEEVNMYTEWTVPTFNRRNAKSSECLAHMEGTLLHVLKLIRRL